MTNEKLIEELRAMGPDACKKAANIIENIDAMSKRLWRERMIRSRLEAVLIGLRSETKSLARHAKQVEESAERTRVKRYCQRVPLPPAPEGE